VNLAKFSVQNRLMVNLLSVFILVAGGIAFFQLNREAFPNFSFDIVSINTLYPGATPEEVEKLITQPIEEELRTVGDVDEIRSVSAEGYSVVIVKLDPDASDKKRTVTEIQQAVDRVPNFPADLEKKPITREIRTRDTPIIEIALSGSMPRKELQDLAEELEKRIEDLHEVSTVEKNGWQDEQIWVELDPEKMESYRVSLDEVVQAVRLRNINIPGGTLDTGTEEFLIRTNAEFHEPEEINEIVVRSNEVGQAIRIKDIGDAKWAFEDTSTILRVDGYPATSLVVVKKFRADAITLVEHVTEVVDAFKATVRPDLNISLVNDLSFYIKRRLGILLNNGWIGLILILLCLFIFLSRPVALWTAIGLPIAIGMAIWIMSLVGITINLISMFGLIIVIGMLVDDSIVVAESIYRHMEEGMSSVEAAIAGTNDVIKPVTVTIITTVVFFLPLAFMSGIFGKFISVIPIVVIIALAASLVECLVILPSHLADFGAPKERGIFKNGSGRKRKALMENLKTVYAKVITRALRFHKFVTFGSIVFLIGGIYLGFKLVPLNLFPSKGIEIFFVRAEAPVGTSLEETARRFEKLERLISKLPEEELKNYVTTVGIVQQDPNDPHTTRGSHVGQTVVYLTGEQKRERKADVIMDEIRGQFKNLKDFERIWIDEVKPGPPQDKPVVMRIRGSDYSVSEKIVERVKADLRKIDGVRDVKDDYEPGKKELRVEINEIEIARAGLKPADVGRTVRWAFEGEIATVIREGDNEIDVVVRLQEKDRGSPDTLKHLFVLNPFNYHVPLHKLASFKWAQGVSAIKHYDHKRTITVTANIDDEITTPTEVNALMKRKYLDIGKEFFGYGIEFTGMAKDTEESLDSLKRAFILALFMAFLILASTFNSLTQPILILLAIPYGLLSALVALSLHGEPLSFLAFLGLVGLSGVTVNDSIILIDYINKRRKHFSNRLEAIKDACKTRLRPVILTSITTVFGLGPVAYGIGGNDPFLRPMALTITWGLAFGTVLTLILVPCAYATLEDLVEIFQKRRAARRNSKI